MAERSREAVDLDHARRRFVLECRAAGVEPIDAPYTFTDAEDAAQEARYARRLGYRAKSLVCPDHAAAILTALIPSDVQKRWWCGVFEVLNQDVGAAGRQGFMDGTVSPGAEEPRAQLRGAVVN